MNPHRLVDSRRPEQGFTLIELLVVVSIIALLIAILLPTLGQMRSTAYATVCKSNLKQQGIGLFAYFSDYDHLFPYAKTFSWQYSTEDPSMPFLQNVMAQYIEGDVPGLKVSPAFQCPSIVAGRGAEWLQNDTASHYRYNTDMAIRYGSSMPLAPPTTRYESLISPTEARVTYDTAFSNWYDNGVASGEPFAHEDVSLAVNVLHADGHVEDMRFNEWDELTDSSTPDFMDKFLTEGWQ